MFLILFDTFYTLKTDVFIHESAFLNLTIYRGPLSAGRLNKGWNAYLIILI